MAGTSWDDVGNQFSDLADAVRDRWKQERGDDTPASDEVRNAFERVTASLDDLADAITQTVNDPDVKGRARGATSGLVQALSDSLDQLAAKIDKPTSTPEPPPPADD